MANLPEEDATALFRRIRAGEESETVLKQFRDGDLLLQMQLVPETRLEYKLPYSREFPTVLSSSGSRYLDSKIYEAAFQRPLHPGLNELAAAQPEPRILPGINSMTYQSQYVTPYHAATMIEPRLESAKPSEWTTVSKDDTLMRKLLAAFFTHEYHLSPAFHKDYFLEDMAIGQKHRTKTMCCSSLLVNAVLAWACVSYLRKGRL